MDGDGDGDRDGDGGGPRVLSRHNEDGTQTFYFFVFYFGQG